MSRVVSARRVAVAAVLAGVVVALVAYARRPSPAPEPRPLTPYSEVPARLAAELASAFRPVLRFDSAERWRPMNVEHMLAESHEDGRRHEVCARVEGARDRCEPVAAVADLLGLSRSASLGQNTYLDLVGRERNGRDYGAPASARCPRPGSSRDCDAGEPTAAYYHVAAANGRFYVDYWWFFRYSDYSRVGFATTCSRRLLTICTDHEGDWEGMTVVVRADRSDQFEYAGYAAHEGFFRYGGAEVEKVDGRPVVYIANGSHAAYPKPCRRRCRQPIKRVGIRLPDERADGRADWGRNRPEACGLGPQACLQPLPAVGFDPRGSWNAWAGLWGADCSSRCGTKGPQSPESPGRQDRFDAPWCFSAGTHETCDAPTPGTGPAATPGLGTEADCRGWLGPLVSALACDKAVLAAALGPKQASPPTPLRITINDAEVSGATTPGVVQAVGDPLKAGDRVVVEGTAAAGTELFFRAGTAERVVEAQFDRLGLERGGKLTLAVGLREGVPALELKAADGRTLDAKETTTRRLDGSA